MNINDLTIGQAKEVASIFDSKKQSGITDSMIGKYVIVRSRNDGINSGYVKAADETGIILTKAQRIFYHKPKDKNMSWYEGVAISGLSSDSKISNAVDEKIIIEDYSITKCTEVARLSIIEHKPNAQN